MDVSGLRKFMSKASAVVKTVFPASLEVGGVVYAVTSGGVRLGEDLFSERGGSAPVGNYSVRVDKVEMVRCALPKVGALVVHVSDDGVREACTVEAVSDREWDPEWTLLLSIN